jgi:small-conductance mechanosensitive channel
MLAMLQDPNQALDARTPLWETLSSVGWQAWIVLLSAVVVAVVVALVGHYVVMGIATRLARRSASQIDEMAIGHFHRPLRWLILAFAVRLAISVVVMPSGVEDVVTHLFSLVLIALVAWLLIAATLILKDAAALRFNVDVKDNLRARKVHTQLNVLRRILIVIIIVVASGAALMTFPQIRQLGTAILASAGIIGIVVGFAAQKTLGTFMAGLQIAFSQPIRIDDVVIVEGEWGRIEEVTLTYVVVRIWDLRRLIVPITYFIEKPFQNWTRVSADILGTVFLYVDYTVPVEAIRTELRRILEASESWDRKVCGVQVTNTSERTVELRALMSASDASLAWNLRCEVREKLIAFVQKNYPNALPRMRAELDKSPNPSAGVA